MDLFVVRNAIAVPRGPEIQDAARPLSERGHERFCRVARGLGRLGIRFDRIYHSPWLRAVQTAEFLSNIATETVVTPSLAQSPDQSLLDTLEGDVIALVGHEPWMSQTVSWLLTGDKHGADFLYKKGGVAWLAGEPKPGGMLMRAFLPPKFLRPFA